MFTSLTKTAAATAFAVGLALAGSVASPADAAMRAGGGHGGGGFHGGGGGFHGGGGGFHGGGGGFHGGGGGFHGGGHSAGGGYNGGYGGGGYGDGGYGYGVAGFGLGLLGGAIIGSQYPYYDSDYNDGAGYADYPRDGGADSSAYCAARFKSYSPASGTYLGYDGLRHPCP
jgi:BA14K-like protein